MRNIPFGYKYVMGRPVIDSELGSLAKRIFDMYLSGASLKTIADQINDEYPEINLNKSKINRILEDPRYLDSEKYECLIDRFTYERVNRLKHEKNVHPLKENKAEMLRIRIPIICPVCGSKMTRVHYVKLRTKQKWVCKSEKCRLSIHISDEDLIEMINSAVSDASNTDVDIKPIGMKLNYQTACQELDIKDAIKNRTKSYEELKQEIYKLASMLYDDVDDKGYKQERVQRELRNYNGENYLDIINLIGEQIVLNEDKSIVLRLYDGQEFVRRFGNVERNED